MVSRSRRTGGGSLLRAEMCTSTAPPWFGASRFVAGAISRGLAPPPPRSTQTSVVYRTDREFFAAAVGVGHDEASDETDDDEADDASEIDSSDSLDSLDSPDSPDSSDDESDTQYADTAHLLKDLITLEDAIVSNPESLWDLLESNLVGTAAFTPAAVAESARKLAQTKSFLAPRGTGAGESYDQSVWVKNSNTAAPESNRRGVRGVVTGRRPTNSRTDIESRSYAPHPSLHSLHHAIASTAREMTPAQVSKTLWAVHLTAVASRVPDEVVANLYPRVVDGAGSMSGGAVCKAALAAVKLTYERRVSSGHGDGKNKTATDRKTLFHENASYMLPPLFQQMARDAHDLHLNQLSKALAALALHVEGNASASGSQRRKNNLRNVKEALGAVNDGFALRFSEERFVDLDPDKFVRVCVMYHKLLTFLPGVTQESNTNAHKHKWFAAFNHYLPEIDLSSTKVVVILAVLVANFKPCDVHSVHETVLVSKLSEALESVGRCVAEETLSAAKHTRKSFQSINALREFSRCRALPGNPFSISDAVLERLLNAAVTELPNADLTYVALFVDACLALDRARVVGQEISSDDKKGVRSRSGAAAQCQTFVERRLLAIVERDDTDRTSNTHEKQKRESSTSARRVAKLWLRGFSFDARDGFAKDDAAIPKISNDLAIALAQRAKRDLLISHRKLAARTLATFTEFGEDAVRLLPSDTFAAFRKSIAKKRDLNDCLDLETTLLALNAFADVKRMRSESAQNSDTTFLKDVVSRDVLTRLSVDIGRAADGTAGEDKLSPRDAKRALVAIAFLADWGTPRRMFWPEPVEVVPKLVTAMELTDELSYDLLCEESRVDGDALVALGNFFDAASSVGKLHATRDDSSPTSEDETHSVTKNNTPHALRVVASAKNVKGAARELARRLEARLGMGDLGDEKNSGRDEKNSVNALEAVASLVKAGVFTTNCSHENGHDGDGYVSFASSFPNLVSVLEGLVPQMSQKSAQRTLRAATRDDSSPTSEDETHSVTKNNTPHALRVVASAKNVKGAARELARRLEARLGMGDLGDEKNSGRDEKNSVNALEAVASLVKAGVFTTNCSHENGHDGDGYVSFASSFPNLVSVLEGLVPQMSQKSAQRTLRALSLAESGTEPEPDQNKGLNSLANALSERLRVDMARSGQEDMARSRDETASQRTKLSMHQMHTLVTTWHHCCELLNVGVCVPAGFDAGAAALDALATDGDFVSAPAIVAAKAVTSAAASLRHGVMTNNTRVCVSLKLATCRAREWHPQLFVDTAPHVATLIDRAAEAAPDDTCDTLHEDTSGTYIACANAMFSALLGVPKETRVPKPNRASRPTPGGASPMVVTTPTRMVDGLDAAQLTVASRALARIAERVGSGSDIVTVDPRALLTALRDAAARTRPFATRDQEATTELALARIEAAARLPPENTSRID